LEAAKIASGSPQGVEQAIVDIASAKENELHIAHQIAINQASGSPQGVEQAIVDIASAKENELHIAHQIAINQANVEIVGASAQMRSAIEI
jgi:hypothetical protein